MNDVARIEKLIGMLGSDFDGERANAAGMLKRLADAQHQSLVELLRSSFGGGSERIIYRDRIVEKTVYRDRPVSQPSYTAQASAHAQASRAYGGGSLADKLRKARAFPDLTEWERTFIDDIVPRLDGGMEPTAKQRGIISKICRKANGERSTL